MLNTHESLTKKFINRGMWIYLFTFLSAPLGYIIRITLTHDLSPEEIGMIYGGIGLLTLLGSYTDFWLTESLNYFLPKYIVKEDYRRTKFLLAITMGVQLFTSTMVSIWLFFLADWLAIHYFKNEIAGWILRILSLYFIGIHLLQVNTTFLNAIQDIKAQKIIEFLRLITTMSGILILFFSNEGNIYHYTWMWIIGVYVGMIFAIGITLKKYYHYFRGVILLPEKSLWKQFLTYSLGTLFTANVGIVLHQIDMQFLTYFIGVRDTGIYSIYLSLISIPFLFLTPLVAFLLPVVSELSGRSNIEKIRLLHGTFTSYFSSLAIWFGTGFLMIGVQIATLLFGDSYHEAGIALIFISPFLIFNILIQINFQILAGTGNIRKRLYIMSITLLYNILISLICILWYKYHYIPFPNASTAASIAVWLTWIPMWYLSYRSIREYSGSIEKKMILHNAIFASLTALLYFQGIPLIEQIMSFQFWDNEVLRILFAFLLCVTIFLLVNRKKIKEFLHIVRSIRAGTYQ